MKLNKLFGVICLLIAFNLLIWLFIPTFISIREFSSYFDRSRLSGYELFAELEMSVIVIIMAIGLLVLSLINAFTVSKTVSNINIFVTVILLMVVVIGYVITLRDTSYVSFGFVGVLYFLLLFGNIFANVMLKNTEGVTQHKSNEYDFSEIEK